MPRLPYKQTMDRIELYMRAGFPVLYIVSFEETRVLDSIAKIVNRIRATPDKPTGPATPKSLCRWYEGRGLESASLGQPLKEQEYGRLMDETTREFDWLRAPGLEAGATWTQLSPKTPEDALAALERIKEATPDHLPPALAFSVTVLFDVHQYLKQDSTGTGNSAAVRPLRNAADRLRRDYEKQRPSRQEDGEVGPHQFKTLVVVSPSAAGLSPELERDVIVLDFPLPETDELTVELDRMIALGLLRFPVKPDPSEVLDVCGQAAGPDEYRAHLRQEIAGAGRGLTSEDYKLALNMFEVKGGELGREHTEQMLHMKATAISDRALEYTPHVKVKLGGLDKVKEWVRLRKGPVNSPELRDAFQLPVPKGALLCGVSGGGKSQLAKLIATEFNLALLRLDIGALFGMYVGESEERTRKALQLAEVLSPVVLWLDEIDKAFGGMGGGGDNGVSARVFGYFLTWMAEKKEGVFVVATANDFRPLLDKFPEFGRKGRFDEIFWVDLPDEAARREVFRIYLEKLRGSLRIAPGEVGLLCGEHQVIVKPPGGDPVEEALWLLSQKEISGNMTGAEIEYAVSEGLYERYRLAQKANDQELTLGIIANAVHEAQKRALYIDDKHELLTALRKAVRANHWVEV